MQSRMIVGALAAIAQLACAFPTPSAYSSSTNCTTSSTNNTIIFNSTDAPIGYASLNRGFVFDNSFSPGTWLTCLQYSTTGGQGGSTTTVSSLDALKAAVEGGEKAVVYVSGTITGSGIVRVGSNKSILGKDSQARLAGVGLVVNHASNVIIRNLAISKVKSNGDNMVDAVGIQASGNVWLDHLDLSSDKDHGKDFYDGLVDISADSNYVTVSNTYFHDHYKACLAGHGDKDAVLQVTFANNYWENIFSRTPLVQGGKVHVFNSLFDNQFSAIDVRNGAQVLVESNNFATAVKHGLANMYSDTTGYAVVKQNKWGETSNKLPKGTLTSVPYKYTLLGGENVEAAVKGVAGNTLTLG